MSCAEITVWSVLEYFGAKFPEYRTILPSEIIKELERRGTERVLPTRGLEYSSISGLFQSFGFSPRLYVRRAFGDGDEQRKRFMTAFYYYIESGIPLAVGISGLKKGEEVRHSVVCFGHETRRREIKISDMRYLGENPAYPFLDAADLYERYAIMDDNRIPYRIDAFDRLPGWDESEISAFAVPLFRNVFLEAEDVSAIVRTVFASDGMGFLNIISQIHEIINQDNPIILRVFLASSSAYRGSGLLRVAPTARLRLDGGNLYAQTIFQKSNLRRNRHGRHVQSKQRSGQFDFNSLSGSFGISRA